MSLLVRTKSFFLHQSKVHRQHAVCAEGTKLAFTILHRKGEQAIASLGLPSSLARIADDLVFLDWGTALVFLWRVKHVVGRSEEVLESFSDVHFVFFFLFLVSVMRQVYQDFEECQTIFQEMHD